MAPGAPAELRPAHDPSPEADDLALIAPLLKTNLEAPDRPRLVVREDLLEVLAAGSSQVLTLVYGPAGCGKTMLAARQSIRQR
jgi:ATP/maltotriose-dependent transcriptional regulator MalT